jgi:hypothetical protein
LSQATIHGLIGLVLFVTGLVALYAVSASGSEANEPVTPSPVSSPNPTSPAPIEGVGPEVEQALTEAGRAAVLGPDALSQIPPQVAKALIENGVVLTVPPGGSP